MSQLKTALRPGVVTGEDYATLLGACKAGGYALPAVNVIGTSTVNAVLEAAAKNRSDVIVQASNGGARFFAGEACPDPAKARVLGGIALAQHVHLLAEHYGICVVLHTDHADRKLLSWVDGLIDASERHKERTGRPLYSSHMIDLSAEPIDTNIAECQRVLRRLTPLGMSLELELGVTGGEEDGIGHDIDDAADNAHLYTQPEDVLKAVIALRDLGHVTVAASFGNVHGVYAPGNVKLRPEILKASQELVSRELGGGPKPLDLVFHGGSGSDPAQIREAVSYGVFKMNIDTDTQFAFAQPVGDFVKANPVAFSHQVDPETAKPYKKQYDPRKWLRLGEAGIVARLDEAFEALGSRGRSLASS